MAIDDPVQRPDSSRTGPVTTTDPETDPRTDGATGLATDTNADPTADPATGTNPGGPGRGSTWGAVRPSSCGCTSTPDCSSPRSC